ncbi:hypothetical protein V5799_009784 [Amblyomma americanum]|uniref:Secreted protein n=1 Tax=Amblyomma americanum TaxID=6943 RepID=A0AAQ4F9F0_AMBAM
MRHFVGTLTVLLLLLPMGALVLAAERVGRASDVARKAFWPVWTSAHLFQTVRLLPGRSGKPVFANP